MRVMLASIAILSAAAAPGSGQGPSVSSAALIQQQFDAYNRHDAAAMARAYAPVFYRGTLGDTLKATPRDTLAKRMAEFFVRAPRVRAKLLERIVHGSYIIDREHVTGLPGDESSDWIMIYEVRDGLILRNWVIVPPGKQD